MPFPESVTLLVTLNAPGDNEYVYEEELRRRRRGKRGKKREEEEVEEKVSWLAGNLSAPKKW